MSHSPGPYSLLSPAPHTDKSRFSEKVAATQQFDGVSGGSIWKTWMRNYLVSRAMEMDHLLKLVETHEDREATVEHLRPMTDSWIHYTRVHQLSWELWGFLNLNLKGDARLYFENVQDFQGFEAWRKIMKLVRNRAEVRKLSLHDKVQKPAEAKRLSEVPAALETWDSHVRQYIESGGRAPAYEDRKLALINILPSDFRPDMLMRLQMLPDPS